MESPKCRLCGERHWGLCAGISTDGLVANIDEFKVPRSEAVANVEKVVANTFKLVANVVANKHGKYRDMEKRRRYMRDLMRKRRSECE